MEQTFRTINTNPATDLENKLNLWREASYAYYNSGETIMSDENFDTLSEYLRNHGINLSEVGAPIESGQERNHTFPMLSLGKVKVFDEFLSDSKKEDIVNKLKRYGKSSITDNTKIIASYKLDGCGIDLIYENGLLVDAITRGNGTIGKSVFKKMFKRLPTKLENSFTGSLRGEFVMKKRTFIEKYAEDYANPRNLIAGILGDQNLDDSRIEDVDLKLYSINGIWHVTEIFDYDRNKMTVNGIPVAMIHDCYHQIVADIVNQYNWFKKHRQEFPYPTDGFVIQLEGPSEEFVGDSHEPYHMIAVKFPPVKAITTVKSVELNLRKSGEYVPKLILEPVECDGSVVSKCAAYNWGYISEFGLFPGAEIEIGKNGDIIPYVQNIRKPAKLEDSHIELYKSENAEILPGSGSTELPTDSYISGVHLYKSSANSEKIKRERFIQQCYRMELKGFGWSAFNQLYDYVNGDFIELFNPINLQETMLAEVFPGSKTRKNWINAIKTLKEQMTLYWFIGMMSFPRCGWAMAKQIARKASHLEYNFSGLEKSVIENIFTGSYSKELGNAMNRFRSYGGYIEPEKEEVTVFDATYEMTGVPNAGSFKTKEDVQKFLYRWKHTPLTKNTTYLITNDKNSKTNKMKKAEANGTIIITYAEAIELHRKK